MALAIGGFRLVPVSVTTAVVLAASGLAVTASSASGAAAPTSQTVSASLSYLCQFPAGQRRVQVAVNASLPAAGKTGSPIQPAGVKLTLALPPAAVAALASMNATTVHAATRLAVATTDTVATGAATTAGAATSNTAAGSVVWRGASHRAAPMPAHGGLTLPAPGRAPSLMPAGRGNVALTAGSLVMTFTPGRSPSPGATPVSVGPNQAAGAATGPDRPAGANQSATATAGPTPPARAPLAIRAACTLASGQQAVLATVPVAGAAARMPRHAQAAAPKCPKLPKGGLKLNPRFPPPPIIHAPGTKVLHSPSQACAFTTGYADARKLKGALLIPPGDTNVVLNLREVVNFSPNVNYFEADNAAQLDFHGLHEFPPTTATFLSFGFVPTTATVALVEHGTINIFAVGPAEPTSCKPNKFQDCHTVATVDSRLSVQVIPGSVKVNGVPLDVGANCHTGAFDAQLVGTDQSKPPYGVQTGGPILGTVNIPQFHHCGAGENLDPIFNAAIAGPQNFNLLTQGAPCFVIGAFGCDPNTGEPAVPKPLRKVSF